MSLFFFELYAVCRDLHVLTHSFPTLRSSVRSVASSQQACAALKEEGSVFAWGSSGLGGSAPADVTAPNPEAGKRVVSITGRSEEHTSELQSLMRISYAVF